MKNSPHKTGRTILVLSAVLVCRASAQEFDPGGSWLSNGRVGWHSTDVWTPFGHETKFSPGDPRPLFEADNVTGQPNIHIASDVPGPDCETVPDVRILPKDWLNLQPGDKIRPFEDFLAELGLDDLPEITVCDQWAVAEELEPLQHFMSSMTVGKLFVDPSEGNVGTVNPLAEPLSVYALTSNTTNLANAWISLADQGFQEWSEARFRRAGFSPKATLSVPESGSLSLVLVALPIVAYVRRRVILPQRPRHR